MDTHNTAEETKKVQETEEHKKEDELDTVQAEKRGQLFQDLAFENDFTEVESLCMNCEQNGITRILLIKIPFFKVNNIL
jgi:hypothetical protein